jgi:hypothetical protein
LLVEFVPSKKKHEKVPASHGRIMQLIAAIDEYRGKWNIVENI